MAAHLETLLPEGSPMVSAALDVDTRNPLTQLNHLCATLFRAGVPINLTPLFEHRHVRELDLNAPEPPPSSSRLAIPLRIDWTPLYHESVPLRRKEHLNGTPASDGSTKAMREAGVTAENVSDDKPPAALSPEHLETTPTSPAQVDSVACPLPADLQQRLPVLGTLTRFDEQELVIVRRLDLAEDLYLKDHLFIFADVKPVEICLPILPLTMNLEFAAEAAALLSPGQGLIGFENVRGYRWVGLRDCSATDLRIEAKVQAIDSDTGVRRVEVSTFFEDKLSFAATVLFAAAYRQDLDFTMADSASAGPWPFPAEDIYRERLMFHGPAFHCITRLFTFGNPGSSAALAVLPKDRLFASKPDPWLMTDPCLMDGVGQTVGLWARAQDQYILPVGVQKIEFYRPTPPVGTTAPIRLEILEFDQSARQIRCNMEIEDGQGNVWVRVAGWTDWILKWSKRYFDYSRFPTRYLLGEELELPGLPAGSVVTQVMRQPLKGVDMEWAGRLLLHAREMPELAAAGPLDRQRQLVCARGALKDAARLWWSRQYGTALPHPAEMVVAHDQDGRPYLEPADDPALPHVSVAHTDAGAVAVAANVPVGIDIETAHRDTRQLLSHYATADEAALIAPLNAEQPDEAWGVRLWCAKEAVGKVLGIGLQGRPKDFQALEVEPNGELLIQHEPTGERFVVYTTRLDDMVIAHTCAPSTRKAAGQNRLLDIPGHHEVK
jgi:phosphopantetheinyl transferase